MRSLDDSRNELANETREPPESADDDPEQNHLKREPCSVFRDALAEIRDPARDEFSGDFAVDRLDRDLARRFDEGPAISRGVDFEVLHQVDGRFKILQGRQTSTTLHREVGLQRRGIAAQVLAI